jgi:cold shock CspA family protein/ribosome-associated translation inhibitor RaiA
MKLPVQITFRNMPTSDAVAGAVREKCDKLDELYDGIIGCRVAIESLTRRHHQGNVYRVRVDLTVPGEELVSGRECDEDHSHEDIYVAIRDYFDQARRLLLEYVARQRGHVEEPHHALVGRVIRLFPSDGYGFLEASEDGHMVYFHQNSVRKHAFNRLTVGTEVRYEEEDGEKGPQATTVYLPGREGRHVA